MKYCCLAVAVLAVSPAHADEGHAQCPMQESRLDGVNARHDAATHVSHEGTTHHFVLAADGGTIRLEADDPSDTASRDRIRQHLQVVARAFAAGDFALPMLIHAETPPGVPVMKERRDRIRYAFAPTERGGEVRIATADRAALEAVHAFLRYQIADHATGDPTAAP